MTAFRPIRPALDPGTFLSTDSDVVFLRRPALQLVCRWSVDSAGRLSCRWQQEARAPLHENRNQTTRCWTARE